MDNKVVHQALKDLAYAFGNAHPDRRQWYFNRLLKEDWDDDIFVAAIEYLIQTEEYKGLPPYAHIVKAYENKRHLMTEGGRKPWMRRRPGLQINEHYAHTHTGLEWDRSPKDASDMGVAVKEAWREYATGQKKLL